MKKINYVLVLLLCGYFIVNAVSADDPEDVELAHLMANIQYFMHKAGLSISAENNKLANFYLHELEEVIEEVEQVESYDGYPIGQLTKSMLSSSFEALENKVKSSDMNGANDKYEALISACNGCHVATAHGYINIQHNDVNPYLQSFE